MNEGRFDALAGYGALLPLWRASAFDLPMAWAASFDIMVTEALRYQAGFCTKLADCESGRGGCRTVPLRGGDPRHPRARGKGAQKGR
jgi:hypothetical protein